jgi:hypothetical protein
VTVGNSQTSFEAVAQHGFAEGPPDSHDQAGRGGPRADPEVNPLDPAPAFPVHSRISATRSHSQAFAPFAPAACDNSSTARCAHTFAKSVFVAAFAITGLKSPFQRYCLSSISVRFSSQRI